MPDFTFFASAEVVSLVGATPIFVDVDPRSFNLEPEKLVEMINKIKAEGEFIPKAVIAVDLFCLPADYEKLEAICKLNNLKLLEDGAQGFSGRIGNKYSCSSAMRPPLPSSRPSPWAAMETGERSLPTIMKRQL